MGDRAAEPSTHVQHELSTRHRGRARALGLRRVEGPGVGHHALRVQLTDRLLRCVDQHASERNDVPGREALRPLLAHLCLRRGIRESEVIRIALVQVKRLCLVPAAAAGREAECEKGSGRTRRRCRNTSSHG